MLTDTFEFIVAKKMREDYRGRDRDRDRDMDRYRDRKDDYYYGRDREERDYRRHDSRRESPHRATRVDEFGRRITSEKSYRRGEMYKRSRSRSRSRSRGGNRERPARDGDGEGQNRKRRKPSDEESGDDIDAGEEGEREETHLTEEELMASMMGFGGFDSTKVYIYSIDEHFLL